MAKLLVVFYLLVVSSFCAYATKSDLETVPYVDLERYLGTWYEIARFDQSFQKGCTGTKALYEKKANGEIKVTNSCYRNSLNGKYTEATARAWVVDTNSNAKLKVQFFLNFMRLPIFAGNYWIIELDEVNYTYAVVGDPSRKYLWILNRTKVMPEETYEYLLQKISDKGFDTSKLIKTIQ
ncbi:MAG: lipocalin family protein [Bacteriovoracaceae bacterium]